MAKTSGKTPSAEYAEEVQDGLQEFQNPVTSVWGKLKSGVLSVGNRVRDLMNRSTVGSYIVKGFDFARNAVSKVASKAKELVSNITGVNQSRTADAEELLGGVADGDDGPELG